VTYHIILLHHVVGMRLIYYRLVSHTTQVSSACCFFASSFDCWVLPSSVENIFHWKYKFTQTCARMRTQTRTNTHTHTYVFLAEQNIALVHVNFYMWKKGVFK